MDSQKEQSIKEKLSAIKKENETCEVRIRKLKSLINQMNLRLMENPQEKEKILGLQKLGYEAIIYVYDSDKETDSLEVEQQMKKTQDLIKIIESEIKSFS